jgi:hypothetical protein
VPGDSNLASPEHKSRAVIVTLSHPVWMLYRGVTFLHCPFYKKIMMLSQAFDTDASNEYRYQNGPLFTDAQILSILLIWPFER